MSNLNNNTQQLEALLQKVNELPEAGSGGIDTSDATATQNDILSGKTAYVDGEKITGTIATKTSSNLTASGATVTVPAGYYASQATKSVSSGSAKTPATTITKNPTISVNSSGVITASVSGTQNVTPTVTAGYVSSGTAGTITVNGSTTQQLTTQAAKTITPSTSSQTAVAKNVYTTGEITVNPIPSDYIVTDEISAQDSLISQIQTALQGKAASSGEDVTEETAVYTSLTSELESVINSLPDAGSGGTSEQFGTCIVNINCPTFVYVYYTQIVDNKPAPTMVSNNLSYILTNVMCGSLIVISMNNLFNELLWSFDITGEQIEEPIMHVTGGYFIAPTTPNSETTIQFIYD